MQRFSLRTFLIIAAVWLAFVIIGETMAQMPWQPTRFHPEFGRTLLAVIAGWAIAAAVALKVGRQNQ